MNLFVHNLKASWKFVLPALAVAAFIFGTAFLCAFIQVTFGLGYALVVFFIAMVLFFVAVASVVGLRL